MTSARSTSGRIASDVASSVHQFVTRRRNAAVFQNQLNKPAVKTQCKGQQFDERQQDSKQK